MRGRVFLWLALAALAVGRPADALTYVNVSDVNLAGQADLVATVEVVDKEVETFGGKIYTRYTMLVDDLVKGTVDGAYLTVRVIGGLSEELGVELRYFGAPEFYPGERALLFLTSGDEGSYHVLHFALGAFWEKKAEFAPVYVRDLPEPGDDPARSLDVARDAERFLAWLRDEVDGRGRDADYLVALPTDRQAAEIAPFTIFDPLRVWTEFHVNPPGKVTWKRHKSGQKGVKKKGKGEAKKVFKVLNKKKDAAGNRSLVNMSLKGTVKTSKLPDIDGACASTNVIVYDNASGSVKSPYSCTTGGVLGVGGACRFTQQRGSWKGEPRFAATSGRVVFNSNTECFYKRAPRAPGDTPENKFGLVLIHEMLHTLGLRHSCGDSNSPSCSKSAVLNDATMRASVHFDGRGAQMREDDMTGFWQLYDPNFFAAPCGEREPGHKKFCKSCGPCGEGQGACKKNKECADGLKCKNDSTKGYKTCQP